MLEKGTEWRIEYIYLGISEQAKGIYVGREHMEKGEMNHERKQQILSQIISSWEVRVHVCVHTRVNFFIYV